MQLFCVQSQTGVRRVPHSYVVLVHPFPENCSQGGEIIFWLIRAAQSRHGQLGKIEINPEQSYMGVMDQVKALV